MKICSLFLLSIVILSMISTSVFAQTYVLKGTVVDEAGNPLVGVNVIERGTRRGTVTDASGKFSLSYSPAEAVIVISAVGYKKQEIHPDGKTEMTITLQEGLVMGDVLIVGSRSMNRSVTETPSAIDVIGFKEVTSQQGQLDVNQILQYVAPSFNANRQSGADGSDHIDPASLRGLGPDQTLVLVNGKRRHQSSLINIFGTRGRGNTGTDLNAIPASAIDRIEILRDGAAAQYGSDAIAGVINIILKENVDQFTGSVSSGVHSAKLRTDRSFDGEESEISGNFGLPVGDGGFLNTTLDYLRKGSTNRPAPASAGSPRNQFGDAKLENFSAIFNAGMPSGEESRFYAFGGLNHRRTDAFAWTRSAGSERNIPAIYPNGFDPRILSTIRDQSVSAGMQTTANGWDIDVNNTFGVNRFHYFVDGTLNASLLEKSPTRFDAGGFQLSQNTTGINVTRFFSSVLSGLNVAVGTEYRIDNYQIFAGEDASWRNYGVIDSVKNGMVVPVDTLSRPGGSQGFPGFRPDNVVDEYRTNIAAYADIELDMTKVWMIAAALRFENYSDFGSTTSLKFASRYKVTDDLSVRASVSTGFRAPSLTQIYFNSTFTDFVAGVPVDKLIAKSNSAITRTLGIPSLKEETSQSISGGVTYSPVVGLTATIDGYYVSIEDRIVLTGAFDQSDPDIGGDLTALDVGAAQFFANALDTKTTGVDVVLSYMTGFDEHQFHLSYAGNFNSMELGTIKTGSKLAGKVETFFGKREQKFLLASAPSSKMSVALDYTMERFHASARVVHFGEVILTGWDNTDLKFDAALTADLSVGYDLTENTALILGVSNLLDTYPTQMPDPNNTESGGVWEAVQMGFSGRFMFVKLNVTL